MKTLHTSIFYLIFILFIACKQNSPSVVNQFDEAKETQAIMEVIEEETRCFFSGDYDCWANTWSKDKLAMQAWNNTDNSYDAVVGWDNIDKQGRYWIKEYYGDGTNVLYPFVKREKPQVKFFNDKTAYIVWKQYNADKENENFFISQESRLMEKQDDDWKILNVTAFWDRNDKIPIDEVIIE